jgi:hypothetical protein
MRNFAEVMISRLIDQMSETSKLCEIALCILVSTAICERGFSRQNFKKNKFRNCLGVFSLDNLMKICDGPADFENFNFNAAVRHSYAEKKGAKLGYLPRLWSLGQSPPKKLFVTFPRAAQLFARGGKAPPGECLNETL